MPSIEMNERFQVDAPVDKVWRFLMDPERVVQAMPGAQLEEIIDDRNFLGTITVKVGAIKTSYRGKVHFTEVDESQHVVKLIAEGQETGQAGVAKGTMSSKLTSIDGNQTEVVMDTSVDVTGRIMQVGRGMIKGVSHQLFLEFVKSSKAMLEKDEETEAAGNPSPPPRTSDSVPMISIVLKTIWAAIAGFFRGLFGRSEASKKGRGQ